MLYFSLVKYLPHPSCYF